MSDFNYLTISKKSEGIYKEKGSKFIAFAFPTNSIEDCKKILDHLKSKYSDARHICYAYRLGADHKTYRANDDGEPNGTAGLPILSQIKSNEITNVLIVVVRYFGGTKLGASGLITAYKTAAVHAISNAEIIEKTVKDIYEFSFDFDVMGKVLNNLKKEPLTIIETNMKEKCIVTAAINKTDSEALIEKYKNQELTISWVKTL